MTKRRDRQMSDPAPWQCEALSPRGRSAKYKRGVKDTGGRRTHSFCPTCASKSHLDYGTRVGVSGIPWHREGEKLLDPPSPDWGHPSSAVTTTAAGIRRGRWLGNLLRMVNGGNVKKQNIKAARRGLVENKARELAEKEVRVGLKKSTGTWELQVRELKETMARKEEVLQKLAAELEVMTARLGEKEKLLVEAKASKEQATSKLAADLARARAEATKARENANDSEGGALFARLSLELDNKKREVNQSTKILLAAAGGNGSLAGVLGIKSLGAIYLDELQAAVVEDNLSTLHVTEIFDHLGELLQRPDLNLIERSHGKTTHINREVVCEPLRRLLETETESARKGWRG